MLLPRHSPLSRRGFTFLEVMLVLAIMIVIIGLTWPLLERPLAYERLRSAADKIRAAWIQARIEAQTSGEPHVFTILSEDEYEVTCRSIGLNPDAGMSGNVEQDRELLLRFQENEEDRVSGDFQDGRLPNDVTFDLEQSYASPETAAAGVSDAAAGGVFSITFYPDGTTDDLSLDGAGVVLKNKFGHRMLLQIRGLTGVVTMTDLEDEEPAPGASAKGGRDE